MEGKMEKEYLEMILEDINGKFDLILEGQESLRKEMHDIRNDLSEKIENNSFKIDVLNKKIDGVAVDLKDHRADTEAHQSYQVRED